MQGSYFRGVRYFCTAASVLSLDGKVKQKTNSTAWQGIHFHKNNLWNILVIGNYDVNYQNYQHKMRLSSSDTRQTLMHLSLFPPKENWFQYVRRVYTTAINFSCIITLIIVGLRSALTISNNFSANFYIVLCNNKIVDFSVQFDGFLFYFQFFCS